ncbi:MAG: hypothetical protein ACK2VD_14585 [Anaerolineae bacterium]|jgi:hypothetical protein
MDELVATAAYYGTALLYPIVTGPLAAYMLLLAWRRPDRRLIVLFWPALIVLHAAGFLLMRHTLDDLLIGPGALSCMVTPVFAVTTALGMRIASRRSHTAQGADRASGHWLVAGNILIPLMQLVTVAILALLAPSR